MASVIFHRVPSESRPGRFGIYGGRYVPETLMAALARARARIRARQGRCRFPDRTRRSAQGLRRPSHAALLRQAAD